MILISFANVQEQRPTRISCSQHMADIFPAIFENQCIDRNQTLNVQHVLISNGSVENIRLPSRGLSVC